MVKVFLGGCLLSLVLRNIIGAGVSREEWQGKGPQASLVNVWPNVDVSLRGSLPLSSAPRTLPTSLVS